MKEDQFLVQPSDGDAAIGVVAALQTQVQVLNQRTQGRLHSLV